MAAAVSQGRFATVERAQRAVLERCAHTEHAGTETVTQRCNRCHKVFYCGRDHQVADWKIHKDECKKLREAASQTRGAAAPLPAHVLDCLFGVGGGFGSVPTYLTSAPTARARATAERLGLDHFSLPSSYPAASVPYEQTALQTQYLAKIKAYQEGSILGNQGIRGECKRMGQEIFNEAKTNAGGDSQAGREALQTFIHTLGATHFSHFGDLERAWAGVGDSNFTWMP